MAHLLRLVGYKPRLSERHYAQLCAACKTIPDKFRKFPQVVAPSRFALPPKRRIPPQRRSERTDCGVFDELLVPEINGREKAGRDIPAYLALASPQDGGGFGNRVVSG